MNLEQLLQQVNARLGGTFQDNSLLLVSTSFDKARGRASVCWSNDKFMIEIYSDPQGGEINCKIAANLQKNLVQEQQWQYLYELAPLSVEELSLAHRTFRSESEQLDTLAGKLKSFLVGAYV